jgi:hypothetical protein
VSCVPLFIVPPLCRGTGTAVSDACGRSNSKFRVLWVHAFQRRHQYRKSSQTGTPTLMQARCNTTAMKGVRSQERFSRCIKRHRSNFLRISGLDPRSLLVARQHNPRTVTSITVALFDRKIPSSPVSLPLDYSLSYILVIQTRWNAQTAKSATWRCLYDAVAVRSGDQLIATAAELQGFLLGKR